MSCQININAGIHEWSMPKETIMEKFYPLLRKDKEIAGKIDLDLINKKTSDNITFVTGSNDSVEAPKSIVNYHTHPSSCYNAEKTTWGWVSAEDLRESILFALKGSIAHIVPAIEVTYIIQV